MDRTKPAARPLIITSDPQLLDDMIRLSAAAGYEADVFPDTGGASQF